MNSNNIIYKNLHPTIQESVYELYSKLHPNRDWVTCERVDGLHRVRNMQTGEVSHVPSPFHFGRVQSGNYSTSVERVADKYTLKGHVEIENDDIVIDIGSFIGSFSVYASQKAKQITIVEPDPRLEQIIRCNISGKNNIDMINVALSNKIGESEFMFAEDPSENSLINIDSSELVQQELIETLTFEELMSSLQLPRVDMVKMDVEGAEPEVIEGFGDVRPRKLAIDCGAERRGRSTLEQVENELNAMGYQTFDEDGILFARMG